MEAMHCGVSPNAPVLAQLWAASLDLSCCLTIRNTNTAGANNAGQLADGTETHKLVPSLMAGAGPFKAIVSGPAAEHTMVIQV